VEDFPSSYSRAFAIAFCCKTKPQIASNFLILIQGDPDPLACVIRELQLLNRSVGGAMGMSLMLLFAGIARR
jgi:hypothetical protein